MEGFKFQDEISKCGRGQKTPPGQFGEYSGLTNWGGDKPRMIRSEDGKGLVYHLPGFLQKWSQVRMAFHSQRQAKLN
jgi:hypothetical protein